MRGFLLAACVALSLGTTGAFAQDGKVDDATLKLGQRVFLLCRACHTVGKDEGNKIGPNLYGVFGSKAGSKPNFRYSDALVRSGVVWNDQTLDKWLTNPTAFIPGTRMPFAGVHDEEERKAVIAYLKHETSGQ